MGSWGENFLENDQALDVIERWKRWVDDPTGVGYDEAIKRFLKYWGDAVRYGDSVTNAEILALVAIHLEKGVKIPDSLSRIAIAAINRELVDSELAAWSQPAVRAAALRALLAKLGGTEKVPKPIREIRDDVCEFKSRDEARTALVRLVEIAKKNGYKSIMFDDRVEVPRFLRVLHRLMMHRIWEKDKSIEAQAFSERKMMLAWYLGLSSRWSIEEITHMLDDLSK